MKILLVEDNPDDVELIRRSVDRSEGSLMLEVASTSQDAHARLAATAERPGLILLDISLPGENGLEVLRDLKADPNTADIPVIMLSGSNDDDDVRVACDIGAHSHFVKPMSQQDFAWVTTSIRKYWQRVAALPSS